MNRIVQSIGYCLFMMLIADHAVLQSLGRVSGTICQQLRVHLPAHSASVRAD